VVFRDLDIDNDDLNKALCDAGYTRFRSPDSMVVDVDWADWNDFLSGLSYGSRRFHRRHVIPREGAFTVEVLNADTRKPTQEEWDHLHRLYMNVKERSLTLNTFALPDNFLPLMLQHRGWEIITLTLKSDQNRDGILPHAFGAAYVGPEHYAPMVVGLDYRVVGSHGAYLQCLRETFRRAEECGATQIYLGMGAEREKERFGARRVHRSLYLQSRDHYQHDVLSFLSCEAEREASS
jgi:hypothetical protein